MAHPVADLFLAAAEQNLREEHRLGNVLVFRPGERLIATGDIHGHRHNLARIINYAALTSHPKRMLVTQEIIHGGPGDETGGDRSFEPLIRAARLKNQFPHQVHFLLGNHDIAQFTRGEISKDGEGMCKAFAAGLTNAFGQDCPEICQAVEQFLRSQPLAARCPNGVFLSHSLPSPGRTALFDPEIFRRPYQEEDFRRGGGVYEFLWGRRHDEATLHEMADLFGSTCFINGHQPQETGYSVNGRQLIITSDNSRGVIAEFDADEEIEPERLPTLLRPIASL